MNCDTQRVLVLLRELAHHTVEARHGLKRLTDASASGRVDSTAYALTTSALTDSQRAVEAAHKYTELLHDQLVPADGLGELGPHVTELGIRATRLVVLTQLRLVCAALGDQVVDTGVASSTPISISVHRAFDRFAQVMEEEFGSLTDTWTFFRNLQSERDNPCETPWVVDAPCRTIYRAMRALRFDPEIVGFLRIGTNHAVLPALREACSQLTAIFDIELDPAAPLSERPWRDALSCPRDADQLVIPGAGEP
jgi:hypothetical protein